MRKIECYLIVDLRDGLRVLKNRPATHPTEVVVKVNIKMPEPPRLAAVLDIELPEPPESVVDFAVEQWTPVEESEEGWDDDDEG